jgi:hypothetical protein
MIPTQSTKPTNTHSQIADNPASAPIKTPAALRTQAIAVRAYELWLERGCPNGSPEQDWYRAEQEFGAPAESQRRAQRPPAGAQPGPRSTGAVG